MPLMRKNFDSPEAIEQAFYDALEQADLDGLMALWSDDDEIVYIPPGGTRLIGHHAIRAAWRETFANGAVHVRPTQTHVLQTAVVSMHSVIEQVLLNHDGQTSIISLIASNVFFKGPRGWRLVLHHASPLPEDKTPRPANSEGYLH